VTHHMTLRPGDIHITVDWLNRECLLIPDSIAAYMASEIKRGWETHTGRVGQSDRFVAGTTMFDLTEVLLSTYADSTIPDGIARLERALRARASAAERTDLRVRVIAQSGWNSELRRERRDASLEHLRLPGAVQADPDGAPAYRWAGVLPAPAGIERLESDEPVNRATLDDASASTPSDEWYRTAAYSDIARYESGLVDYDPGPDHDPSRCSIAVEHCPKCRLDV
jgi:hypothetical protein